MGDGGEGFPATPRHPATRLRTPAGSMVLCALAVSHSCVALSDRAERDKTRGA